MKVKIAFFDTHPFDKDAFEKINLNYNFDIQFYETRFNDKTLTLAHGSNTLCLFVNDRVNDQCMSKLSEFGIKLIALRSAGFNHIDLLSAKKHGIMVVRVPAYSPHAVAEFAIGMLLSLNRKIHHAYLRVKELNFSLNGLVGFDLYQKHVGVIGTGKTGKIFAQIMAAFGCKVWVSDLYPDLELMKNPNIQYVDLDHLCRQSDVVSLHLPLTPETHHLINSERINQMRKGVIIINTGRGALIDSKALVQGLKDQHIGGAALDVYEEEENIFFQDLSNTILQDDILARLLTFPNVLITSHQAFLTKEALANIATTTLENIDQFSRTGAVDSKRVVNYDNNGGISNKKEMEKKNDIHEKK